MTPCSSYEILVEISCCKYLPADKLMKFWQDNKDALINLMFTVHMGVKGLILAQSNNNNSLFLPKEGAEVVIVGQESIKFRSTKYGEYFKLLLPGDYTLKLYLYPGGMPEYINMNASSYEILVEISCCKYLPADKLMKFWQDNKDALINLMFTVHMGVKGLILAQSNNNNSLFLPKEGAEVVIVGQESIKFRSTKYGEYFKLLLPGDYTLTVDYPGYLSTTTAFRVDKSGVTRLDINLIQMSNTTDISLSKPPEHDQNSSSNFSDSLRRGQSLTKDALLFLALFTVFYLS